MKRPDEREIIEIFRGRFGCGRPEDVEYFESMGRKIIVKVDTLVESTDIPPGAGLGDMARKSIVACVSDFAAKGARPRYGIVSVTIPRRTTPGEIVELADGLAGAAREFGFRILGGDTNGGREIVIQVSLFGVEGGIVPRSTAKRGDLVFVTGPFGYAAAGLQILLGGKKSSGAFSRRALDAFLRPVPRTGFVARCGSAISSSMDSSDGLSTTLVQMAGQSRKRFLISRVPANRDVGGFAGKNGLRLEDLVFDGGEEYEIVFTVPRRSRSRVLGIAGDMGIPLIEIGEVSGGSGVFLEAGGKTVPVNDGGWRHLG